MSFLFTLLTIAAGLYVAGKIAEYLYAPRSTEDETHYVTTNDGWRLAIHRYRPRGEDPHGEPVILHHGFASTSAGFDLGVGDGPDGAPSLAHALADRGYDVFLPNLRGRAPSDMPRPGTNRRWDWSVDDYIERDDPAIVDYVLRLTGYSNLHWIGHSMGGILLLAHGCVYGGERIASGVTVASGFDYGNAKSYFGPLTKAAFLAPYVRRVGSGFLARIYAFFAGRFRGPIGEFHYWPENISPAAARAIHTGVEVDVSGNVCVQLATLLAPGGLIRRRDGACFAGMADRIDMPLLMLVGDRDRMCPEVVGERTRALIRRKDTKVVPFGREHGHISHYGHFDLLCGRNADREVYPHIVEWLAAHPATRADAKPERRAAGRLRKKSA
ncbi:alpha/beta fold hydrolase [bacterium]|nr:alpha/beta fold hydrolase [bacterium]